MEGSRQGSRNANNLQNARIGCQPEWARSGVCSDFRERVRRRTRVVRGSGLRAPSLRPLGGLDVRFQGCRPMAWGDPVASGCSSSTPFCGAADTQCAGDASNGLTSLDPLGNNVRDPSNQVQLPL